jgi:RNA polymerase sigma factor (sigma-70 family)
VKGLFRSITYSEAAGDGSRRMNLEREEIRELLERAVEMLPNIYRQVFLLRDVEELTISDTAKILDISIPMVKTGLHRLEWCCDGSWNQN